MESRSNVEHNQKDSVEYNQMRIYNYKISPRKGDWYYYIIYVNRLYNSIREASRKEIYDEQDKTFNS